MDEEDPKDDPQDDPKQDGIYRTIQNLMLANLFVGGLLILLGEGYFKSQQVTEFGFMLGFIGALLYFFFRWLAGRAARRNKS